MPSMRELRERRATVSSIEQITKAMKVVSVSKLRRTQRALENMRPFAEKSREVFRLLADDPAAQANPFIAKRDIKKVCYVLFVGNKGLCGAYNNNVLRFLVNMIAGEKRPRSLVVAGRWGSDMIRELDLPVKHTCTQISDTPDMDQGIEIAGYLRDMYLSGEADEIVLVYEKYHNVMLQKPEAQNLLPVELAQKEAQSDRLQFEFEPERRMVLDNAVELYIVSALYGVLLEAKAGEHASRMTAMTTATDNTEDLLRELKIYMNRARQAEITTQISEIVGGASAMKKYEEKEAKRSSDE